VFAQKTNLKQAVDIIADPAVDEKKWLAACAVVGDKKIALNQECPVKKTGLSLSNAFFATLITANMIGVYIAAEFLSANITWLLCGQDVNFFMEQTWVAGAAGFPTMIGAALALWLSIGLRAQKSLKRITLAALSMSAWLLLLFGVICFSPWGTVFAGVIAFGTLLGSLLGRAFDRGLPSSFPLNQTIAANAGGSVVFGSIMLWVMWLACTQPHHVRTGYSDPSLSGLWGTASIVAIATFAPALLSTLAMKSKALTAPAAMNLLLQSPVFLGLLTMPVAFSVVWAALCINPAAVGTFMHLYAHFELSPLLAQHAGAVFVSLLVPPVVAAGSIVAGSSYGVWSNRKAAERRQKREAIATDAPAAC
jgi:hypothetical protein